METTVITSVTVEHTVVVREKTAWAQDRRRLVTYRYMQPSIDTQNPLKQHVGWRCVDGTDPYALRNWALTSTIDTVSYKTFRHFNTSTPEPASSSSNKLLRASPNIQYDNQTDLVQTQSFQSKRQLLPRTRLNSACWQSGGHCGHKDNLQDNLKLNFDNIANFYLYNYNFNTEIS